MERYSFTSVVFVEKGDLPEIKWVPEWGKEIKPNPNMYSCVFSHWVWNVENLIL